MEVMHPYIVETDINSGSPNQKAAFKWCHKHIGQATFYRNDQCIMDGSWSYDVDLNHKQCPMIFRFGNKKHAVYFKLWMQGLDPSQNRTWSEWYTPGGHRLHPGWTFQTFQAVMGTGRSMFASDEGWLKKEVK